MKMSKLIDFPNNNEQPNISQFGNHIKNPVEKIKFYDTIDLNNDGGGNMGYITREEFEYRTKNLEDNISKDIKNIETSLSKDIEIAKLRTIDEINNKSNEFRFWFIGSIAIPIILFFVSR